MSVIAVSPGLITVAVAQEEHDDHAGEQHDEQEQGALHLDELKDLNIQTGRVQSKRLSGFIEATAEIKFNETRHARVIARTDGWVEKVRVYANETVKRDALLAEIYSPEFLSAQQEYLLIHARAQQSSDDDQRQLRADAAQRLRILGLTDDEIKQLENSGTPFSLLHVHSPIRGAVIDHSVSIGANITAGQTLYNIADLRNVWVDIALTDLQLAQVKPGQAVQVSVKAYPQQQFSGKILSIAGAMDETTRTVKARALVDNAEQLLKPGMFAEAAIEVDTAQQVTAVPGDAIVQIDNQATVFKRKGDALHAQTIATGLTRNGWTEVVTGLAPGDEIVTRNAFVLKSLLLKSEMGAGHGH